MTTPLVSVVMPARNAAETVERAVQSICCQTLSDWELIAIDDRSGDDTGLRLSAMARRDSRIKPVPNTGHGIVTALHTGLSLARGRFIARMDADDISEPDRLEEQSRFLQQHPGIGLVGSLVAFGGDRELAGGFALHVDWLNSVVSPAQIALNRFVESPFAHPSVMFRRDLLAEHGSYRDGDFPEDYELWLRWLEAGVTMAKVPRVLLTWNDSPTRLSRTDPRYRPEAFYRCKALYLSRWLRANVHPRRSIWIWGAGRETRRRVDLLSDRGVLVRGYVDIDPRKQGRSVQGRPVVGPEDLPCPADAFVLGYVAKRGARQSIRSSLTARGFVEGHDFLLAA